MEERSVYKDISRRTNGDVYIGVVGPVRTGKSTFIKRFMDTVVLPNISDEGVYNRTVDELPQSSGGRTIMTTEPKFIPEESINITLSDKANLNVRMVDCVGYIVDSALGYIEEDNPRMVKTPWFDEEIPFGEAAEIGTKKVITDHSTIGLLITTDGSVTDIERSEYAEAEKRVVNELKAINKPFIVLLNCVNPDSDSSKELADKLSAEYMVPVVPVNCMELDELEIKRILAQLLFEFPIKEIDVDIPERPIFINADKIQLSRVITNLITNAMRHNPEGTKIKVSVTSDSVSTADDVRIFVADSGDEIPSPLCDQIFDPFVTGDESRASGAGTGLGLALSNKICDMHGFTIKLVQKPEILRYRLGDGYQKVFVIAT